MLLTLFNGLVGTVCGVWLRVYVLVPLTLVAIVEVVIVDHAGTWLSALWLAIALVVAIEIGYLAGAAAVAASSRRADSRDFVAYRQKSLSPH